MHADFKFHEIREAGEAGESYWLPLINVDGSPSLEPGEQILWNGTLRLRGDMPRDEGIHRWQLDRATCSVTDRRFVYITPNFLRQGQQTPKFKGHGAGGVVVAAAATAAAERFGKRAKSDFAVGNLRYEWLTAIEFDVRKPLFGSRESTLRLFPGFGPAEFVLEAYGAPGLDAEGCNLLLQAALNFRRSKPSHQTGDLPNVEGIRKSGSWRLPESWRAD